MGSPPERLDRVKGRRGLRVNRLPVDIEIEERELRVLSAFREVSERDAGVVSRRAVQHGTREVGRNAGLSEILHDSGRSRGARRAMAG